MQSRTCLLSALPFTLGVALALNTAAIAGDLPKEGTYSVTYSSFGTLKSNPVGKQVVLFAFDENGLSVRNGLLDHLTWHCWGLFSVMNGFNQTTSAYCVATDPNGDQLAASVVGDKWPQGTKSFTALQTWITGTGKYAGISGNNKLDCHPGDFRPAAEGTYHLYCTFQGSL
jgi:hypothetical protein